MLEAYERILKALNLEKWMSPKQLARLLYPDLYRENWRKAYDRLIKNLQSLRQKDLLRFKDYGLGKDNLWSIKPNPLNKEFGYIPPKAEIHSFKYEHEKACADVFVTLALTNKLYAWEQHKKIGGSIIPDRTADYNGTVYIEVEMGSQDKVRQKSEAYKKYFQETKEPFSVWFLVKEQWQYDSALEYLRHYPSHYSVELLDEFNKIKVSDTPSDTVSDGVIEEF
jgi:hypothetical protein